MSCWWTTRSSGGGVAREPALRVALGVVERHHEAGSAHRVEARVDGQLVRAPGDGRQRGVGPGRAAVVGVDRRHQRVPLSVEPIDRELGLAHQVDQAGSVAAANLAAAGDTVGGRQQESGQQADDGDAETPDGAATARPRLRLVHRPASKNSGLTARLS